MSSIGSTHIRIRPLSAADVQTLVNISVTTFAETFSGDNSEADMQAYLSLNFNESSLRAELENKANRFYAAEVDGEIAGYAKLGESQTPGELNGKNAIELERIYVLQKFQKQKTGAALLRHVIEEAKALHKDTLWLGVWEHNHKALAFYNRWGFNIFGSHIFTLGSDDQTDLLMELDLRLKMED